MKTLVVLPSYNERANIIELIAGILANGLEMHVCVVDDSSPDGTATVVEAECRARPEWKDRVQVIVRPQKDGRGGAVRRGFAWGLESGIPFTYFVEMDCDLSHDAGVIPQGTAQLEKGYDVVVGSRYPDGSIEGWPWSRKALSFGANLLARILIDWSVTDYTTGFRFYSKKAVQVLVTQNQRHRGYIYLSESLSLLLNAGMRVGRFPIHFKNREHGVSKTSSREVAQALGGIFLIAWRHRLHD